MLMLSSAGLAALPPTLLAQVVYSADGSTASSQDPGTRVALSALRDAVNRAGASVGLTPAQAADAATVDANLADTASAVADAVVFKITNGTFKFHEGDNSAENAVIQGLQSARRAGVTQAVRYMATNADTLGDLLDKFAASTSATTGMKLSTKFYIAGGILAVLGVGFWIYGRSRRHAVRRLAPA